MRPRLLVFNRSLPTLPGGGVWLLLLNRSLPTLPGVGVQLLLPS